MILILKDIKHLFTTQESGNFPALFFLANTLPQFVKTLGFLFIYIYYIKKILGCITSTWKLENVKYVHIFLQLPRYRVDKGKTQEK